MAEVSVEQALRHGAAPEAVRVTKARTLAAQREWTRALTEVDADAGDASQRAALLLIRAEAQLALAHDPNDRIVSRAFARVLQALADDPATSEDDTRVVSRLAELAETPAVLRARAHVVRARRPSDDPMDTLDDRATQVLRVSAGSALATPADAARVAKDGARAEIECSCTTARTAC